MLYDPKWELHSMSTLIGWLETKPVDEGYYFFSCRRCLLLQYLAAIKGPGHDIDYVDLPETFKDVAFETPWTFGAALKRARAAAELS